MAANNGAADLSASALKDNFPVIQPLILKQWPAVDTNALAATAGEAEKVIALIVEKTKANKTDVSQKLAEISQKATPEKKPDAATDPGALSGASTQFNALLERLERRTQDLVKDLRGTVMVNARDKVRDNLLLSLLTALGFGVILGLLLGLFRGGEKRS